MVKSNRMRLLMLLGGFIGFLIGVLLGAAQGSAWPGVLWRSSVAAFLAGVVLRWWGKVWARNLQEAQRERHSRPARAASAPAPGHGKS
jgi:hypothetical protein